MKIKPHYRWLMTLVSRNISFMWIFAGVPWRGGRQATVGNEKRRLSVISDAESSEP